MMPSHCQISHTASGAVDRSVDQSVCSMVWCRVQQLLSSSPSTCITYSCGNGGSVMNVTWSNIICNSIQLVWANVKSIHTGALHPLYQMHRGCHSQLICCWVSELTAIKTKVTWLLYKSPSWSHKFINQVYSRSTSNHCTSIEHWR